MSEHIIPIIEPVKLSSPLIKTMSVFQENSRCIGLIRNPRVGRFIKELKDDKNKANKDKFDKLLCCPNLLSVLYADASIADKCAHLESTGISKSQMATICILQDSITPFEAVFSKDNPRFHFIPDESVFRRRSTKNKVLFEDRFKKKNRNVDYANLNDEPYSSDHIFYAQDGYVGFSDFSIIGDDYSEAGFAPYAVAIHIVYFDADNVLRIHHFVSDTNDDITDPAGKFGEALEKLVDWNKEKKLNTYGIQIFEDMFANHSYPGLGTVKKLAIMHHLELIGRYLDGVVAE
jgi:hypothetical protein